MTSETIENQAEATGTSLRDVRVLAAINSIELFGHERGNIEVFRTLRALGAKVRVGVRLIEDNHVYDELDRSGFETFALPFGPQWSLQWVKEDPAIAYRNARRVWQCSRAFSKEVSSFNPTHFHLGSPLAYSYLSLALARHRLPLIYRMGDCPPVDSPFNLRIWRMAVGRADRLVAISEFVRSEAVQAGADDATVIYNLAPSFADVEPSEPPATRSRAHPRLLYVGAVSEYKGVDVLIRAMALLRDRYPSIQLEILGGSRYDTEHRSRMIALANELGVAEIVDFIGHVPDPSRYYRAADVHVHPAMWEEPLGNTVMEAKRSGIPSVVFPSGGLPEMIEHRLNGLICQEKTIDSLVDELDWAVRDKARLKAMGQAAQEDYEIRFGPRRFDEGWATIYRDAGLSQ